MSWTIQELQLERGKEILGHCVVVRHARRAHAQLDFRFYPQIEVVDDQRWVDNGKLITSAGLSSGIDAALHLVSRLRGEDKARSVALHLEYDWRPDHGFVRGRMADRLMPPLREVKWPQDMAVERLYSLGDERQWRQRLKVSTAMPPEGFVQLIANDLDNDKQWRRDASASGHVWQRAGTDKPARFSVTSHPGASAQEFELEFELQRGAAIPPHEG